MQGIILIVLLVALGGLLYTWVSRRRRDKRMGIKRKSFGCLVAVVIGAMVLIEAVTGGFIPVLKVPFFLIFGWIGFIIRVAPSIRPNPEAAIAGIIGLGILGIGAHLFLQWLYRNWGHENTEDPIEERKWRPRWTAIGIVILVLMFATSIAFIGSVHQIGWLIKSDEPMMVSSWAKRNIERDMASICQTPFRDFISAEQYRSELWKYRELREKSRDYHVLTVEGLDDHMGVVVVFPRDPVQRKEIGVRVCRGSYDIKEHNADELPKIIEQVNDGSLFDPEN